MGINHPHSPLICRGDRKNTLALANRLENLKSGYFLHLSDAERSTCPSCDGRQVKHYFFGYTRITLLNLSQGAPMVRVVNWSCPTYMKLEYFTGKWAGVFPIRRDSAFRVDLLYIWVQGGCAQGNPLWSSHKKSELISSTGWSYRNNVFVIFIK